MVGRGPEEDGRISGQTKVDPSAEDPSFLSKKRPWLMDTRWQDDDSAVSEGGPAAQTPFPGPKGAGFLALACRMGALALMQEEGSAGDSAQGSLGSFSRA